MTTIFSINKAFLGWIKENWFVSICTLIILCVSVVFSTTLHLIIIGYVLIFKLILHSSIPKKFLHSLKIMTIITTIVVAGLIFYANHYFPKGPMFDTGDVVCANDDRGSCHQSYIEDVHALNIPEWGKLFKQSSGELLLLGLIGLIFAVIGNEKNQIVNNEDDK